MQRNDGVGSAYGPEYAGLLEADADDGLATGFDHAGANEEPLFPKRRVLHPMLVDFEVIGLGMIEIDNLHGARDLES